MAAIGIAGWVHLLAARCPACGNKAASNAYFCSHCGVELRD
jgi:uncharacterized OB-fold protein